MPETVIKLFQKIKDIWNNFDKSQKNKMLIISTILIVAMSVGIILLTRVNYIPLMTISDSGDAKEITKALDDKKIPYKPGTDGVILVDSKYKNEAEFAISEAGLTSSGMTFTDAWSQIKIGSTESDKKQLWNNFKKTNLVAKLKMFYNIKDADLVLQIIDKTKILDLTIKRSLLTGMALDRVNASIASFLRPVAERARPSPS